MRKTSSSESAKAAEQARAAAVRAAGETSPAPTAVIRRDRLRLMPEVVPEVRPVAVDDGAVPEAAVPEDAARAEAAAAAAAARQAAAREGRQAGYQEGYAAGQAAGEKAARDTAAAQARELLAACEAEIAERWRACETDLGQLSLEIASHLMGVAVGLDPELVARSVTELVAEARELGVVEVVVAPEDLPAVTRARQEWSGLLAGETDVRVRPDAQLSRGECRVETHQGGLSRNWPNRLQELSEAFRTAGLAVWDEPASRPEEGGAADA